MELSDPQEFKDELFVSNVGAVYTVIASVGLYFSITSLITFSLAIAAQNELMGQLSDGGASFSAILDVQSKMMHFAWGGAAAFLWLLVAALALWKRKNWGRILFTVICIALMLATIAALAYNNFFIPDQSLIPNSDSIGQQESVSKMYLAARIQVMSYSVFLLIGFWLTTRVLFRLNKERTRICFH